MAHHMPVPIWCQCFPMPLRARSRQMRVLDTSRLAWQFVPGLLDEHTLIEIASTTGGQYFRATDSAGMQTIYAAIDHLEKTATVAEYYQQYAERFPLPVVLGLGLLVLEIVLVNTRWRTIP